MRACVFTVAAIVVITVLSGSAIAATKRKPPVVERSAAGTVIQPTKTIDQYGHTTVIIVPRHRSYLEYGTEVSPGDRNYLDYMLPPAGDPGRPNWFIGPDTGGAGRYPLPGFGSIPGYNPYTPF